MLHQFRNVETSYGLQLEKTYKLDLMERKVLDSGDSKDREYIVSITMFDSNHCPGSCMTLLQGYMGTFLHTGDMRANTSFV